VNSVTHPTRLFEGIDVQYVSVGSESTVVVDLDERIWVSGWNEHGNLATGDRVDQSRPVLVAGAPVVAPALHPELENSTSAYRTVVAAGGAHLLAIKIPM
jgi:alpha-tubulin suppressor-like RCC1 family protein